MTVLLLSKELLDTYEHRLVSAGIPLDRQLRPGLSRGVIDARCANEGVTLPAEALTWFSWHDGAIATGFEVDIAPGFSILTLDESLALYRDRLDASVAMAEQFGIPTDAVWRRNWFPFLSSLVIFACDCGVEPGLPSPVHVIDTEDTSDAHIPRAPSMGEMVCRWIAAWDDGDWYADGSLPQRRRMHYGPDGNFDRILDV